MIKNENIISEMNFAQIYFFFKKKTRLAKWFAIKKG
jgi:hypothetical protein